VFVKYKGRCAICGAELYVQAHHLIPREMYSHRYIVENGILLCAKHHRFSFELSPHKSPIAFAKWMITHQSEQWCWLLKQEPARHNTATFQDISRRLGVECALEG